MIDLHPNIVCACASALLTCIIDTNVKDVGWRNYLLIVLGAVLTAAAVVEAWFLDSSIWASGLIGFGIGYVADMVIVNLNATMPEWIAGSLRDVLDWLRRWLGRILNK